MKLLLVPPDVRPPTLAFPVQLARAAGAEVTVPPAEALPNLNQPGNFGVLRGWLEQRAPEAHVLIVSLETLALGGMIPARRVDDPLELALKQLALLETLKNTNPDLRILAGGVIVRVAHGDDPVEEKPYYGLYGGELRRYSTLFDRVARHGGPDERAELEGLGASLPPDVLQDWLGTRGRNHALHVAALGLLKRCVLEHLCLTLDDTSEYGLAAVDRRALEGWADENGVWGRFDLYPGADEVPCTLLARALQTSPTRVYVRYSSTLGAAAGLLYEDRPVGELVKAHLRAAGAVQADTLQEADLVLAVNTPGRAQREGQPDFAMVDTAERHLPEFVDFIGRCLAEGKPVSVADIAYPNGAEGRLMRLLDPLPLAQLAGFGGWNTAGNTLGGTIAQGVVSLRVQNRASAAEALFSRLVDDHLYQGRVRRELYEALGDPNPFDLGTQRLEAERLMDEKMTPLALELWRRHFAGTGLTLHWETPHLAWPRLFTGVFPFSVREP